MKPVMAVSIWNEMNIWKQWRNYWNDVKENDECNDERRNDKWNIDENNNERWKYWNEMIRSND